MKTILILLAALSADAFAANYSCTAVNVGDYDVVFRAEGKEIKNWRTLLGHHGKNLEPQTEIDARTNEFSFFVDESRDANTYIKVQIRNGEVLKSQVWLGGNDTNGEWGQPTGLVDICERISN